MNNYLLFGIITILVVSIVITIIVIKNKNKPVVRYSCKSGKCVLDPNGKYTTNTCDDECNKTPTPPIPPAPTTDQFTNMALTASPGTGIIDVFPFATTDVNIDWNEQGTRTWPLNKIANKAFSSNTIYKDFINASFKNRNIVPCNDLERSKFLSYLMGYIIQ
jgi:hypothetical protein